MADHTTLIRKAYDAFNRREIDGALALMSAGVSWPKASEGGRAVGGEEIRTYWTHQWEAFAPHVEPVEIFEDEGGRTRVRVHQVVKSLGGEILYDGEVWHVFTISDGLIDRMDLEDGDAAPSEAFTRR